MNKKKCKEIFRYVLAGSTSVITIGFIITTVVIVARVSIAGGINDLPFNELTKKSVETRLDLSRSLFELALLMLGALWALVIAKKDEAQIVLSKPSEALMFLGASLLLLLSVSSHAVYLNNVTRYLADAAASSKSGAGVNLDLSLPNIFDRNVNYVFVIQIINLIAGVFNAIATIFSAHKLKGG